MSESTTANGWQALGKLLLWSFGKLQGNDHLVYMAIARKCVGYYQYTTELLSYSELSKLTGVSVRSIERIVPKLIASGFIIKVATNQISYAGKLPYKYQLNMKLAEFPSLGNLYSNRIDSIVTEPTPEPKFICPPVEDYFIINGQIALISDPLFAGKLAIATKDGIIPNPTVEQLTNHLRN